MQNFLPAPLAFFEIVFRQNDVVVSPKLIAVCEQLQDKIQKTKSPQEMLKLIYETFKYLNNSKVLCDISVYHMRLNGFTETSLFNNNYFRRDGKIDSFNQLLELIEITYSINQNIYSDSFSQMNV